MSLMPIFQEAHREEMLVNRLMRQSQQERRIAVQLMQVESCIGVTLTKAYISQLLVSIFINT